MMPLACFQIITKRGQFLEEMEQVVPWEKLCALIEPVFFPYFDANNPTKS
jgi:hypothetical protein